MPRELNSASPLYRLFVVGCPRSGTTIIQRELVHTYRLYSLPETHFFGLSAGGGLPSLGCYLGLARTPAVYKRAFARLHALVGGRDTMDPGGRRYAVLVERFSQALDRRARQAGERGWLEKTPRHVLHLGLIRRFVADARVVHAVRWGPDVVGSIVDRARRYSSMFAKQTHPEYGIKLWNRAIKRALRDILLKRAEVVFYEDFVEQPESVITWLGQRLELPSRDVAAAPDGTAIVTDNEWWKADVAGDVRKAASKFRITFDPREQKRILAALDIKSYERLVRVAPRPDTIRLPRLLPEQP